MVGFNEAMTGLVLVVIALIVAARLSPVAKYYLKSFVLNGCLMLNSFIIVPYGLTNVRDCRRTALFSSLITSYVSPLLGVKWDVEMACGDGVVGDKATRTHVIVCNHQSALDVCAMMRIWPQLGNTVTLVKKELLYSGPFGIALWLSGAIFVDRARNEKGRKNVNDAGRLVKESGANLWVFPEGTRNVNRDGSMLPFKKGAFHVALDANMPILPVVISEYDFLNPKKKRFEPGRAKIKVLEPISLEGYSKDNIDDLITNVRNKMLAELGSMSAKKSQ